ncbi:MAG TPA: alpha/beta family hydrolase [Acidimicrobiales bacterium]
MTVWETPVEIVLEGAQLQADLAVPPGAGAVVLFAHGSGSGRDSPRNRQVARRLQDESIATVLLDLLTQSEEAAEFAGGRLRFDIELLASRLEAATEWVRNQPDLADFPLGYFGASTGAGAALVAAAREGDRVGAVVSRGGRPDLAGDALKDVRAPTLLIVGARDTNVLELNREAAERLTVHHEIEVIEGATHLFEEPGALEQVADLASMWFRDHLIKR